VSGSVVATPTNTKTPAPTKTKTKTPTPTKTSAQGNQGDIQGAAIINDPYVGLGVACNNDLSATFTMTNIGGPLVGGSYTVSEPGKSPVTFPLSLMRQATLL
jgi:hypothetical protein